MLKADQDYKKLHTQNRSKAERPSFFVGCFTIVGFSIAIAFFAGICTAISHAVLPKLDLWGSFSTWCGLVARFFLWTANRGIEDNLQAGSRHRAKDAKMLGEQFFAGKFLCRIVEIEVVVSIGYTVIATWFW